VRVLAFPARSLECDKLAVEKYLFGAFDSLAEHGWFAGDDDAPFFDPTLDLPPRTKPQIRERLLNSFGQISSI
jgi:hypothetical protein